LLKLAAALGITLTELLSEEPEAESVAVVAGRDTMTLWSTRAGSAARLLVGHGGRAVVVDARARRSTRQRSAPPRSAWFDATLPHTYANPGTTTATFTLVVFEPA
jgi:hypothetical protein